MIETQEATNTKQNTGAEAVRWDLADLYAAPDDPAIKSDFKAALSQAEAFQERYKGRIAAGKITPDEFLAAVEEIERIFMCGNKAIMFAHLVFSVDTADPAHGALLQRTEEQVTAVQNALLFFDVEWRQADGAFAERILAHPPLARYAHSLAHERVFARHTLTEAEEKLAAEKRLTGISAFQRLFDERTSRLRQTMTVDGERKEMNETELLALLYHEDRGVRRRAQVAMTKALQDDAHILTFIFNVAAQEKAIEDRLRDFPDPMSSRNLGNEVDDATAHAMLDAVTQRYDIVADYYTLKRRMLGYRKLYDYDRYAPVFPPPEGGVDFAEAKALVLDAYHAFSPELGNLAGEFFEKQWIDAAVLPSKRGGAYCQPCLPSLHPYVFLNYTGNQRDVMTLAHELGHGIHARLSREQSYLEFDTSLVVAELASTFGEMLTFHELMERTTDPRVRLTLLAQKIEDSFATVFRQAAMHQFEYGLHTRRRSEGELTTETIGEIWMEQQSAMFGDSVVMTENYRHWWAYIPHFIHVPFYVYAYPFGELLSLSLYRAYQQQGAPFVDVYRGMLAAGGSETPAQLMQRANINTADPAFWHGGLDIIHDMVQEAKALAEV